MDWLLENTIFVTIHGSQSYGLATELSDVDIKGICVPPREIENSLFNKFEQAENNKKVEDAFSYLRNPKNPKFDSTIFSLKKFFILASNVNPNIIELLWTDEHDHKMRRWLMDLLLEKRDLFLSSKAKFTFSGYAFAQMAKIERHRKWLILGDLKEPKREDFNLKSETPKQLGEIFGYIKAEVEKWNLSKFNLSDEHNNELKETIWDLISAISDIKVGWDNWPEIYERGSFDKLVKELNLKEDVADLLNKERLFKKAKNQYDSWLNWKNNRNPERAKLEEKSKYDTKHASHLVRLMRMGLEILTKEKVFVLRPDREEILAIKNGYGLMKK